MRRLLICVLAIVAACYRPRVEGACEVGCDPATAPLCPDGLTCGADRLCYDDIECSMIVRDAAPGDSPDGPPGAFCAGAGWLADTCPTTIGPALVLPATINTQIDCTEVIGTNCVIAAEGIAVVGSVQVIGTRPLVLFARENINIGVSSVLEVRAASGIACPSANNGAQAATASDASGGGAGGTFGTRGGNGGAAANGVQSLSPASFGVTSLRGGCPGGKGGNNPMGMGGGAPGDGGGAVYLIAGQAITVTGTIRAPGLGGGGGTPTTGTSAGGGGGGSGGMIILDAPSVTINGVLHAQGGGGGGGGRGGNGSFGGNAINVDSAASGDAFGAASANGGSGAGPGVSAQPGAEAMTSGGAGGGGGGAGLIKIFGAPPAVGTNAKISPPPT